MRQHLQQTMVLQTVVVAVVGWLVQFGGLLSGAGAVAAAAAAAVESPAVAATPFAPTNASTAQSKARVTALRINTALDIRKKASNRKPRAYDDDDSWWDDDGYDDGYDDGGE
jgi:hypothetical protein